jgi:hypothetical protein
MMHNWHGDGRDGAAALDLHVNVHGFVTAIRELLVSTAVYRSVRRFFVHSASRPSEA